MGLTKYNFGDLLELTNQKNSDGKYGEDDAIGVNIDKIIQPMRGQITEKDFTKFHLVPPQHFAYNPRGSRKLGIGFNDTHNTYIITFNDNVFRIKDSAKDILLPTYLFMYLCRKEWDRYAEFISWGSSTEVFDWTYFCGETIQLPDISIQQKYVNVYNAMLANQKSYERGLEDLKLVCDAYIENIRENAPLQKLGNYITPCENINFDLTYGVPDVRGVNNQKELMPTKTSLTGRDLSKFQIVFPGDFVFNHRTSRNGSKFSIAYNDGESPVICTEDYVVFRIKPEYSHKLLARWLYMHFNRPEFDRYVITNSWGSSTEFFNLEDVNDVKIPVPDVETQQDIVDIFNAYNTRKELSRKLKAQIQNICPILIKGSIEEAQKTDEA